MERGEHMTEVVAALIWQGERFMICQRPAHKARGMLWEFVGGKVEPERARNRPWCGSAGRNWQLKWQWVISFWRSPYISRHYSSPYAVSRLHCPRVPQKLEHNDIRYITVDEIPKYEFCPADEVILQKLRQEGGRS